MQLTEQFVKRLDDIVYHEWRKSHCGHGRLSLRAATDWTELPGTLEQTTDACCHAALLLERMAKHRLRKPAAISDPHCAA